MATTILVSIDKSRKTYQSVRLITFIGYDGVRLYQACGIGKKDFKVDCFLEEHKAREMYERLIKD